jgi:hypothetical protein
MPSEEPAVAAARASVAAAGDALVGERASRGGPGLAGEPNEGEGVGGDGGGDGDSRRAADEQGGDARIPSRRGPLPHGRVREGSAPAQEATGSSQDDGDEREADGPARRAALGAFPPDAISARAAATFESEAGGAVAAEEILMGRRTPSSPSDQTAVQWAATGLLLVLVPAALLSAWASQRYRLVVLAGWVLVAGSFLLLFQVLREAARNPRVLHPVLHRWVRAAVDEYRNFVQDWRTQILLLTYEGEGDDRAAGGSYAPMEDGDLNDRARAPASSPRWREGRPRSRVFRALVQPLVPWIQRRRQKRASRRQNRRGKNEQQQQQQQQQDQEVDEGYAPPPDPSSSGRHGAVV